MEFNELKAEEMEELISLSGPEKLLKAREKIITMDAVDIGILLEDIPGEKMLRIFACCQKRWQQTLFRT